MGEELITGAKKIFQVDYINKSSNYTVKTIMLELLFSQTHLFLFPLEENSIFSVASLLAILEVETRS